MKNAVCCRVESTCDSHQKSNSNFNTAKSTGKSIPRNNSTSIGRPIVFVETIHVFHQDFSMSTQSYLFRQGERHFLKFSILVKSSSLDTLMKLIFSNDDARAHAIIQKIDEFTLQRLRDLICILVKNMHQFHFAPKRKKDLKNYEKDELLKIETVQKVLDDNLHSLSTTVKANKLDEVSKVTKRDHKYNLEVYEEMYHILARLFQFVTNTEILEQLPDETSNAIKEHSKDLLKMKNIFCNLPFEGELRKGRYPPGSSDQLRYARNQRDKWMDLYSSLVMMYLKNNYSNRGAKKRDNIEL